MSLPREPVFSLLQSDFAVGWSNNHDDEFVGYSRGYDPAQHCVGTTNGAGAHNVQLVVMTPDRVVLSVLPGFWHAEDLARELRLAQALHRLRRDDRPAGRKRDMFRRLHLAAPGHHPAVTYARSAWQSFDARAELRKARTQRRDTFAEPVEFFEHTKWREVAMKPLNVLVHERMAARPFQRFEDFDLASFVDYGRYHYDNNRRADEKGKRFPGQEKLERQRMARAERREKEREAARERNRPRRRRSLERDRWFRPVGGSEGR